MERVEVSGKSCWVENPENLPVDTAYVQALMSQAALAGSEQGYIVRFRAPHYFDHSVECSISSFPGNRSGRVVVSYGQGWVRVFRRALVEYEGLSMPRSGRDIYARDAA